MYPKFDIFFSSNHTKWASWSLISRYFEDEYNNVSIYLREKFTTIYLKDQLRKFIPPTLHAYFVFLKEYSIFTMVWTSLFDVYYLPMLYKQDIEGKQENLVKLGNAFVRRFNNLVNTYSIIRTIYSVACKFERKIIIDIWKRNRSSRLIYWMNRSTRTSLKHFPKYNFIFCRGEIELIGIEK